MPLVWLTRCLPVRVVAPIATFPHQVGGSSEKTANCFPHHDQDDCKVHIDPLMVSLVLAGWVVASIAPSLVSGDSFDKLRMSGLDG